MTVNTPSKGSVTFGRLMALFGASVVIGVVLLFGSIFFKARQSDETILRKVFKIPRSAKLDSLVASPQRGGWFGREGLSISAEFSFKPDDFAKYSQKAKQSGNWKPMPASREFILKMIGAKSYIEARKRSNEVSAQAMPGYKPLPLPTLDEMYDQWKERLPLHVPDGVYRCLTAGTDIMHFPKVECSTFKRDQNDFMFAVLDNDKQKLFVQVKSFY